MDSKLAVDRGGSPCPPVNLQLGQQLHGFEVKTITPIEELRAATIELAHNHSGARLLHLYTNDTENLFSINFPTPPSDDTGVPHILEHVVLSGSEKYPLKDPWFEMIKMSMITGISAYTAWDHTVYYAASNVRKDLFNWAEFYFDALFYPLLTEQTFKREGHHLAPANPEDPTGDLKITGIVYNETKSYFSDPETCLYYAIMPRILPDTLYAHKSVGVPEAIPDLTYAQLKTFHETYYHPSNSYFFCYGDIPTRDYLAFLDDKLNAIPKNEASASLRPLRPEATHQPRWDIPQRMDAIYPIGVDEPLTEKTYLMLSWLIGDTTDPEDVILCDILQLILLGNEAAPLYKAIIDAKLGADLNRLWSYIGPANTFHVGIKGGEVEHAEAFTQLVLDTLTQIANVEIENEKVETAFQQATYDYKEITSGRWSEFPYVMLCRVIGAWIYEKDPNTLLKMRECLATVRRRWQENPAIFNELIRERLIDNPHRLLSVLAPDRDMQAKMDTDLAERLKTTRAQLTDAQVEQIAADIAELERLNGQPDPPEVLAKLPQLKISDLPEKPRHIPTHIEKVAGRDLLKNDVFANGVNYLQLNFDLQGLPEHLYPYLPRYTDAIHQLGAGSLNYAGMAQRKSAVTGGISCSPEFTMHVSESHRPLQHLNFSLKALDGTMDAALDVLHDLVFDVNARDTERLHDVLVQAGAAYRTEMVDADMLGGGSHTAWRHAARGLSPLAHLKEIVYGLPQLRNSETLLNNFNELSPELIGHIEQIRDFLLTRGRVTASFTGSDTAFEQTRAKIGEWLDKMRDEPIALKPIAFQPFETPPREGLAAQIQIAHCSYVMPAPHYSHPDSMLLSIGTYLLHFDYIQDEIRLKGNAYNAWSNYRPLDGELYLASSADPHIARTINVFDQVADYVKQVEWTQTDIDRAIIGTARDAVQSMRPSQATSDALTLHLTGQTHEVIEERYAQRRRAIPAEVKRALLQFLEENGDKAAVCVVSSREKLETANSELTQPLTIEDILG